MDRIQGLESIQGDEADAVRIFCRKVSRDRLASLSRARSDLLSVAKGPWMPFVDTSKVEPRSPLPGWSGRFVHSEHMTFVYWNVEEGAQALHEHEHIQEEVWNVIDG